MFTLTSAIKGVCLTVSLLFFALSSGCSPKRASVSGTAHSTPEHYVREGRSCLRNHELTLAEIAFKQALKQKPDLTSALMGLAQAAYYRGQWHVAEQNLQRCLSKDSVYIPAYVLLGKIYIQQERFLDADELLTRAQTLMNSSSFPQFQPHICFLQARALAGLGAYEQADSCFTLAKPRFASDSTFQKEWRKNRELFHWLKGKPDFVKEIAAKKQITRTDLALLFSAYLDSINTVKIAAGPIEDLPVNPVRNRALLTAVRAGWLPVLPDDTVRPNDSVQRAELAIFLSHILSQNGLAAFSDTEALRDVPPQKPYYRDIERVLVFRILSVDENNRFYPNRSVTGREGVRAVFRLHHILKSHTG